MTNWMNSQGHRENILSTNFSSIGVGVYKIGNKVYATQEFYKQKINLEYIIKQYNNRKL